MIFAHRNSVLIKGEGIAALSAAQILSSRGIPVTIQQETVKNRPTVLLTEIAHWILSDIWGKERGLISADLVVNHKVLYQQDGTEFGFPYIGYPVVQDDLQIRLKSFLVKTYTSINWLAPDVDETLPVYDLIINAIPKDGNCYVTHGERSISAYHITQHDPSVIGRTIRMMMSDTFWAFLFPLADGSACLHVMRHHHDPITFEEIAGLIKKKTGVLLSGYHRDETRTFLAAPRLLSSACRGKEIAIGSAIATYDPIAGDGTGHGLRSADWACKIALTGLRGMDTQKMLRHYYGSVDKKFAEHLKSCEEYYRPG